ncbi:hypothetical protein OH492_11125 [Vibrio chagasii]|nr:hypothetical protein [Vibrio chagasii]
MENDGIKKNLSLVSSFGRLFFSVCTVAFTLVIGLVLANIVQWEELKGRSRLPSSTDSLATRSTESVYRFLSLRSIQPELW